jgi:hypothetical protein
MTKDWKYIVYLSLLGLLLVAVFLSKTKEHDWSLHLSHLSKDPYGTYALTTLIPDHLRNQKLIASYKTIYELKDSLPSQENILIITSRFSPDEEDTKVLLTLVENGATAFISSSDFSGTFADTLGLATADSFFQGENSFTQNDSASLYFVSPVMDSSQSFNYKRANIHNYFRKIDSVGAFVLAKNDFNQPIAVRISKGKGTFILNCTPIVFTNIYLLANQNHHFVAGLLSYLPEKTTYRTEFYHLGRMETSSPLRFILTNEPLSWAYYITMISLIFFMIFEAKRKQRIIPVIRPLANTTLEFVSTIGNLYYQRGDHKNIADKKIQFFFDYIHVHYFLSTTHRGEGFISIVAKKSGAGEQTIRSLIEIINTILSKEKIEKEELISLNSLLEIFYKKK